MIFIRAGHHPCKRFGPEHDVDKPAKPLVAVLGFQGRPKTGSLAVQGGALKMKLSAPCLSRNDAVGLGAPTSRVLLTASRRQHRHTIQHHCPVN
jgi:hypothetical protein